MLPLGSRDRVATDKDCGRDFRRSCSRSREDSWDGAPFACARN